MPHAFFDLHHTVADDEIDAQQHVHNLRYLQWTLWAARDHSAAEGWDAAAALKDGLGWSFEATTSPTAPPLSRAMS